MAVTINLSFMVRSFLVVIGMVLSSASGLLAQKQEVVPVISSDYQQMLLENKKGINKDSLVTNVKVLKHQGEVPYSAGAEFNKNYKVYAKNGQFFIRPKTFSELKISGTYGAMLETKQCNKTPALQQQFVQGMPLNGQPEWQGAEMNQTFSFGPDVHTLAFDGSGYDYDTKGRLVAKNLGNGTPAEVYDNGIFRNATAWLQTISLTARLLLFNKRELIWSGEWGQKQEQTFIQNNQNTNWHWQQTLTFKVKRHVFTAAHRQSNDVFTNGNRSGYLNALYRDASLTPISFSNRQSGRRINDSMVRYFTGALNPAYLLNNQENPYRQLLNYSSLSIERKMYGYGYELKQAYETLEQTSDERYRNKFPISRNQKDEHYFLKASGSYNLPRRGFWRKAIASAGYFFNHQQTGIRYSPLPIQTFQRSSHELFLEWEQRNSIAHGNTTLKITTKSYWSNTASSPAYFLPNITATYHPDRRGIFSWLYSDFFVGYHRYVHEPTISQSYAGLQLLQLSSADFTKYRPTQEVQGFDGLQLAIHQDWKAGFYCSFRNIARFSAIYHYKKVNNDVFPVMMNQAIVLSNQANHRTATLELEASYSPRIDKNLYLEQQISFVRYRNKVTDVVNNGLPIVGFANAYKALVKDQPIGVIMGNQFKRNASNQLIIGSDGFPLVDSNLSVIGNPHPDFSIKWNTELKWKKWNFSMDWEWSHGGDIWNGTQANLDYYGRSQTTANERGVTGYVYQGVLSNGQPNTRPVSFADPQLPFLENKWVRYGASGVASQYMERASFIKLHKIGLTFKQPLKKYLQNIQFQAAVSNLLVWTPYSGVDPSQVMFDMGNSFGLDFFNLPSTRSFSFGCSVVF